LKLPVRLGLQRRREKSWYCRQPGSFSLVNQQSTLSYQLFSPPRANFLLFSALHAAKADTCRKHIVAKNCKGGFSFEKIVNRFSADILTNAR
jgi:hypothetical protein